MAATDKLAGYRNDPKSNIPQPVEDGTAAPGAAHHEGEDAARKAATAPTPATPLETGERTPQFADRQRQALAERFKTERAAERKGATPASHVPFIDGDNQDIPGALPAEEDELVDQGASVDPDAAAEEDERVQAEELAARAASPAPAKPYTLKVDGNQFAISREELLRYAEVEPGDADQFSDLSLVRLAQKQIAASNRLSEANALKDQARRQSPSAAQVAPAPESQRVQPRRPDPALVSAIEKIQLGDPEEAAKAIAEVFDAGVDHAIKTNNLTRAMGGVQAEYTEGVNSFSRDHPDVIANPVLASSHIALVAREIADDVHALGLVDENQYSAIATNPKIAADVLTAARAEGRQVRTPSAIFEAAFDKLAAIAAALAGQGVQTRTEPAPSATPPQRTPSPRIVEKRTLMPQPARSGVSQIGTVADQAQPEDRIAVASAAIQKMRKARFQPTS